MRIRQHQHEPLLTRGVGASVSAIALTTVAAASSSGSNINRGRGAPHRNLINPVEKSAQVRPDGRPARLARALGCVLGHELSCEPAVVREERREDRREVRVISLAELSHHPSVEESEPRLLRVQGSGSMRRRRPAVAVAVAAAAAAVAAAMGLLCVPAAGLARRGASRRVRYPGAGRCAGNCRGRSSS